MPNSAELLTPRLKLRTWLPSDAEPFAALNADPRVMEHFPSALSRDESDAMIGRINSHFDRHGFSLWAVEVTGVAPFIGFVGLYIPNYEMPFTPCVEIGWRLAQQHWGHGYATEAATAALAHGFTEYGLPEIVSLTTTTNLRSQQVMQRLGMTRNPAEDFDHPKVDPGSHLLRHVLYRMSRQRWEGLHPTSPISKPPTPAEQS